MSSKQASKVKFIDVTSFYSKLYTTTPDGKEVEIKEISDIDGYTTLYRKTAAKGKNKGTMLYAVSIDDYTPRKRSKISVADKIANLKSQGMSDSEILLALQG